MKFLYQYRTPDNLQHEASVSAASRDEAYRLLKAKGVKPSRLEEAPGFLNKLFGKGKRWIAILALGVLCLVLGAAVFLGGGQESAPLPTKPVVRMPRQEISGDRDRVAVALTNFSANAAERFLARFAEPGRIVPEPVDAPDAEEFERVFEKPLRYSADEFTEQIDLKRMVEGLKWEMFVYVRAGGSVRDYLTALAERQNKEVGLRETAVRNLYAMFKPSRVVQQVVSDEALNAAYAYWLKANAGLKAMGVYEIPLPPELRRVQMGAAFPSEVE